MGSIFWGLNVEQAHGAGTGLCCPREGRRREMEKGVWH